MQETNMKNSETKKPEPSPIPVNPMASPVTPISAPKINIVRIQPGKLSGESSESQSSDATSKAFKERSSAFSPGAATLLSILDNTRAKLIEKKASEVFGPEQAERLADRSKLSPKTVSSGGDALGRILARRLTNEEAIDYIILAGVLAEMSSNTASVISEIRKMKGNQ